MRPNHTCLMAGFSFSMRPPYHLAETVSEAIFTAHIWILMSKVEGQMRGVQKGDIMGQVSFISGVFGLAA